MKKLTLFAACLFIACAAGAIDKWGFSLANLGWYGDPLQSRSGGSLECIKFNCHFTPLFGASVSLVEFQYHDGEEDFFNRHSVLPIELYVNIFQALDILYVAAYVRGGWQFDNFGYMSPAFDISGHIQGAAGIKLFSFFRNRFHYSSYFSIYAEYSSANVFKLGFSLDMAFPFILIFKDD
jgi:hypothetical protein